MFVCLTSGVKKAEDLFKEITKKFIDLTFALYGLIITFEGVGWGELKLPIVQFPSGTELQKDKETDNRSEYSDW